MADTPDDVGDDDVVLTGAGYGSDRGGDSQVCYCEGEHPDWDYHHPSGCAKSASQFKVVSGTNPDDVDVWDEPRGGESHEE